ncbi:MAG: TetR family transcriptional regulator [Asticcacaulis sp.]
MPRSAGSRPHNTAGPVISPQDAPSLAARDRVADRLVDATTTAWTLQGRSALSARKLSSAAGAQASQINYYFGNFEQLLCAAQERALTEAQPILDDLLTGLPQLTAPSPATLGAVLAAVIQHWCNQSVLSAMWIEAQMAEGRSEALGAVAARWQALWTAFWARAADRLGAPEAADLLRPFFYGEALLHRIRAEPILDQAALTESCINFASLLQTGRSGPAPLRDQLRDATRVQTIGFTPGSVPDQIARAAARLVGEAGAAAVTHRAVAAAAGLNLGAVTYHMGSSEDLLQAAWARIYLDLAGPHLPDVTPTVQQRASADARTRFVEGLVRFSLDPNQTPGMLAMEDLLSAAARDPALARLGAHIRYTRGQTTIHSLSRLGTPERPLTSADAALVSIWTQGLQRDVRGLSPDPRAEAVRKAAEALLERLGG